MSYENAPIAFLNFGDSSFCHVENFSPSLLHIDQPHMSYIPFDFGVFGDVQMDRCVIMDDAFIYHAHNFFLWNFVCNGSRFIMSTSIEHELTKRALESIFHESCGSFPPLSPFPCVASYKLNNCSLLWFACKHVSDFGSPCDIHVSMIFHIDDLCVAATLMSNFSFLMFVGHHNNILSMSCHEALDRKSVV